MTSELEKKLNYEVNSDLARVIECIQSAGNLFNRSYGPIPVKTSVVVKKIQYIARAKSSTFVRESENAYALV